MKAKGRLTWLDYLNTLNRRYYESEKVDLTRFEYFLKASDCAYSFFQHMAPFVYILDYRNGSYINMSDNFAGYKSASFLSGGLSHTLEIYQKDHLRLFNQEVFPDRLEI